MARSETSVISLCQRGSELSRWYDVFGRIEVDDPSCPDELHRVHWDV